MTVRRVAVLLAAGAAPWERSALELLDRPGGRVVLVKRCLDLSDLLATAAAGSAEIAVVAEGLPGLDADSVERLNRHGLQTVVVADGEAAPAVRTRLLRLGAASVVDTTAVEELAAQVLATAARGGRDAPAADEPPTTVGAGTVPESRGRLLAVWGPAGAPGRTTVAVALAAEAAAAGVRTTLVDADPYGGTAAQHLAVVEEVSGLLAAARAANAGELDTARLAQLAREVGPRFRLLTGLPRADRWAEVRPQAFQDLLETARGLDDLVVVDCGPGMPEADGDPFSDGPRRDAMTGAALEEADLVLAVGSADPVGLTRLARSLAELFDLRADEVTRVVVNRMRPTLGWSRTEVAGLVAGVAPQAPVSFVPEDRPGADRALVSGRPLTQCGDSALRVALGDVAREVLGALALPAPSRGTRWRRRSHSEPAEEPAGRSPGRGTRFRGRGGKRARGRHTVSSR